MLVKFADCKAMNSSDHHIFMHRCLQLALLGSGSTAPNPMVGAVLVHEGRVIGEGYHQQYGGPHAEVHCMDSVKEEDRRLIALSTLYVSLEPCAHFGKTPPCADLVIRMQVPRVVVGCRDPFSEVNGKGIEKLQQAGVEVITGILEKECLELNRRFFTYHTQHRPYIILKWAQTADGRMAGAGTGRLLISNAYTNRIVHRWRSQEMGIMVATRTALKDDPELSTRLWPGKSPLRLVIDKDLQLPAGSKLLDGSIPTVVFNEQQHTIGDLSAWGGRNSAYSGSTLPGVGYYQVAGDTDLIAQMLHALYQMKIQSVLVEGGSLLLQSFIDGDTWDEARIITNESLVAGDGLPAPRLSKASMIHTEQVGSDTIRYWRPTQTSNI